MIMTSRGVRSESVPTGVTERLRPGDRDLESNDSTESVDRSLKSLGLGCVSEKVGVVSRRWAAS